MDTAIPLSTKKVEYEILIRNYGKGCYLKAQPTIFGSKREFSVNWFGDASMFELTDLVCWRVLSSYGRLSHYR